jgi:hypothetical protein
MMTAAIPLDPTMYPITFNAKRLSVVTVLVTNHWVVDAMTAGRSSGGQPRHVAG